ncbi:hypothetical protein L5515_005495 [Caenorhabditis briggsae]|uniref:Uncharacterized protein n=1 Tax=Caenorhabditis briggsae TaxID=6238 RepID=A0AAE9EPG8_CAEBR|nr:hypothetical protein L5515_005495 [Caenorhabditis briggsae]
MEGFLTQMKWREWFPYQRAAQLYRLVPTRRMQPSSGKTAGRTPQTDEGRPTFRSGSTMCSKNCLFWKTKSSPPHRRHRSLGPRHLPRILESRWVQRIPGLKTLAIDNGPSTR